MDLSRTPPKLKALHIASGDLWAGAEAQICTLLTGLLEGGEVEPSAVLLNEGTLAQRLRAKHINVTVLDESKLGVQEILRGLRKEMSRLKPDVIHTHRQKENVLGAIANLTSIRVSCVRTCHGATEFRLSGWRTLHKRMFAALDIFCGRYLQDRIIAVSIDLKAKLTSQFPAESITIVENGVDFAAIRSCVRTEPPKQHNLKTLHIGTIGRLTPVKRVDLFLETAAELRRQRPEMAWQFHIIGDGILRKELQEQAHRLNLGEITTFHGHRNDIATCIADLDAVVMCSDHEGLPMTPLESIALGTPVVAHATGGLIDILSAANCGVLVKDHTARGYSGALLQLFAQGPKRIDIADIEIVERRFSAAENARRIFAEYQHLKKLRRRST